MLKEIKRLDASAKESIDNSKPIVVPDAFGSVNDIIWQGDVGLRVVEKIPRGAIEVKGGWGNGFQLAPGNTKGSRHIIPEAFKDVVRVFRYDDGDPLRDLFLLATGKFDLTHPEHADHLGYPPICYDVRHQQNDEGTRVID